MAIELVESERAALLVPRHVETHSIRPPASTFWKPGVKTMGRGAWACQKWELGEEKTNG